MTRTQAGAVLRHLRQRSTLPGPAQASDADLLGRFAAGRDPDAFAALVRRHGPMVLNVCRSVLRHEQDAEDAFQATFLALARKAGSIRRADAVAGWLYEVAHHVAARARAAAARRRTREREAVPMPPADPTLDMTLRDLHGLLHRELRRLPEKYRLPLVLCYLEGRSHEEAAGQLGWSRGTFRGRLDRGREHLRRRLAARGLALSGLLCAAAVAPMGTAEALVGGAVRAATGSPSPRAAALADGAARAMLAARLRGAAALLAAACLVACGVAVTAGAGSPKPPGKSDGAPKAPTAGAKPPAAEDGDSLAYAGRVLGPDGTPVAGARLHLTLGQDVSPDLATSGPDGRFSFAVPDGKYGRAWTSVTATAPDLGPGWAVVPADARRNDLTLRLVPDDVPIDGRIVDLEGRPVGGASLRVEHIDAADDEDLGPWLEAVKAKKGLSLDLLKRHVPRSSYAVTTQVKTDADGRFRLTGVGRGRLVTLILEGPTLATQPLHVRTRAGDPLTVPKFEGDREYGGRSLSVTYYGATFRHAAAPAKPVVGVVRDRDTKRPLAGVTVRSYARLNNPGYLETLDPAVRTTTDADGRYRLTGMPKGAGYSIVALPGRDQPYVVEHLSVPDTPGLGPVTVDVELRRGVWIEGKITDRETGRPVRGTVEYFARYGNPHLADYPGFDGTILWGDLLVGAREDGSFRIVGLPGPGLLGVYPQPGYLRAPDRDDEFGTSQRSLRTAPYHVSFTINYGALAQVDPARGAESVRRDITLDPGRTLTGTVVGPDGRPLAGALGYGLTGSSPPWDREPRKSADFTVPGFNPKHPRPLLVVHPEKGLAGVGRTPKDPGGPVTVRLEPGATVTGWLVDAGGKPRPGVDLEVWFRPAAGREWTRYRPERVTTHRDGRFRLGPLLPGHEFRLSDGKGEVPLGPAPDSGQTKDLGDVRIKPAKE